MRRITQEEQVLRSLIAGDKVTRLTMMYMGVGNGPEIIRRLRERGVGIITKEVTEVTSDGRKIRYGSYHLKNILTALKTLKTLTQ